MTAPCDEDIFKRLDALEAEYRKGARPRAPLKKAFDICTSNEIALPDWVTEGMDYLFCAPFLEKQLPIFEKAYKTGNYGALKEAIYYCDYFGPNGRLSPCLVCSVR